MMKKILGFVGVSLIAMSASAQAADMDYERQIGLIVSGVVDKWAGVQVIDVDRPGRIPDVSRSFEEVAFINLNGFGGPSDQTEFASGGEGLLSLPLGTNLSVQNDAKYEYNGQAFDSLGASTGPRYWFQGAAHVSWRDPMNGLFGAFVGVGTSSSGHPVMGKQDYLFVGGEGQIYMDNITFYAQGGYIDINGGDGHGGFRVGPDEGFFARGVGRWFPTAQSRLQLEATYVNLTSDLGKTEIDTDVWSWKARYDFDLANMPLVGTLPLYVAYRGTLRDDCMGLGMMGTGGGDLVDHTFMIGTSYSFSGDRLTIDRQGATLDTPDLGNMIGCGLGGRYMGDAT